MFKQKDKGTSQSRLYSLLEGTGAADRAQPQDGVRPHGLAITVARMGTSPQRRQNDRAPGHVQTTTHDSTSEKYMEVGRHGRCRTSDPRRG